MADSSARVTMPIGRRIFWEHFFLFNFIFLLSFPIQCISAALQHSNAIFPSNSIVLAFGDFNADLHSDAFLLSFNGSHYFVEVALYSSGVFAVSESATLISDEEISVAIPSDYNHDGYLDVLISGYNATASAALNSPVYWHRIYLQSDNSGVFKSQVITLPNTIDQLLLADWNNDLYPDFLGTDLSFTRCAFINFLFDQSKTEKFSASRLSASGQTLSPLLIPQSSAFVDFDGDCAADLLFVSTNGSTNFIEIWINQLSKNYELSKKIEVKGQIGMVTAFDVDGDGNADILYTICESSSSSSFSPSTLPCDVENSLHILYNHQKSMCSSIWISSDNCRSQQGLCERDPNFYFDDGSSGEGEGHVIIRTEFLNGALRFLYPSNSSTGLSPFQSPPFNSSFPPHTLHAGDVNLDGFPDLLISTIASASTVNADSFRLSLFMNEQCSTTRNCAESAVNSNRRTFVLASADDSGDLSKMSGVYVGGFFDIGDKGSVDVIANRISLSDSSSNGYSIEVFQNIFDEDAYFLTALSSNGVCNAWCPSGDKFPDPPPYGVNYPGSTIRFTITTLSGDKNPRMGAPLSQSTYFSLQTPYIVFGLGRTNNYVEEFFVGISYTEDGSTSVFWQMWVAMIPNAQVIVFPYEPNTPADWTLQLFISPSSKLVTIAAAMTITLVLGGLSVGYFQWKERKEDEADNRHSELLFRF